MRASKPAAGRRYARMVIACAGEIAQSGAASAFASSGHGARNASAAVMARLHAMNLATWKSDPFMLETHGLRTLEDLEGELKAIGASADFPEGLCLMAQLCIERI